MKPKITQSTANTLVLTGAYLALFAAYAFLSSIYRSGPEVIDPAAVHQEAQSFEEEPDSIAKR